MVEVHDGEKWNLMARPMWPVDNYKARGLPPLYEQPVLPRHYGLYSLLADVRNRTGRGTVTHMTQEIEGFGVIEFDYDTDDGGHDPIQPIDFPRGIPTDADPIWQEFASQEAIHDPTWLTLDELLLENPLYDQVLWEDCIASEKEYLHYRETGELPRMQSRGVGGPGMRVVTEAEYLAGERGEQTSVDFRWRGKSLREDIPSVWGAILGMMSLASPKDYTKVRLLVAFDS